MTALVNSVRREGRVTRRHLEGSSGRARSLHTSAAVSVKPFMSRTAAIYVSNAGAAGQCQGDTCKAASFTLIRERLTKWRKDSSTSDLLSRFSRSGL
ncbi:hypothetical protein Q8A67_019981 [Cirrhinus molitorella]|uniref:Uncharacterized protein n=1 Tax=Cirrhinus molitorella TaxID=172907 RepID=A0AA88TFL7_9TELE|nr:hypothetical protein Q8A67_019981 [Cirrhinus molitorella]